MSPVDLSLPIQLDHLLIAEPEQCGLRIHPCECGGSGNQQRRQRIGCYMANDKGLHGLCKSGLYVGHLLGGLVLAIVDDHFDVRHLPSTMFTRQAPSIAAWLKSVLSL